MNGALRQWGAKTLGWICSVIHDDHIENKPIPFERINFTVCLSGFGRKGLVCLALFGSATCYYWEACFQFLISALGNASATSIAGSPSAMGEN